MKVPTATVFFAMVQDDNNFSLFLKGVMKKYARLIVLLSPRAMSSIMFDILGL